MQEAWLAKLGHWGEALRMYDARLAVTPRDGMAIAGKVSDEVGGCIVTGGERGRIISLDS